MEAFLSVLSIFLFLISAMTFASNRHHNFSYTDVGNGKPIVLIHAFPMDQRLWKPQIDGLKSNFRVITLDLYGFGQAEAVDGTAVTMTEYADQIKRLTDNLHIQKAVIGGESMGGYIALAFLQKYPDSVSGLILADTQAISDTEEVKAKREATAVDILQHGTLQFISGFIQKAISSNAPDETRLFLKNIMEKQAPAGMASALRGMALRIDQSDLIAKTDLPVLIITGDEDAVISPVQSQAMHQLIKNSKLVTIKNTGHLSNLEQPVQWNKSVIDMFVAK